MVLAFVFGGSGPAAPKVGTSAPPGPLASSVPDLDQATEAACDPVLAAMPVTLEGLAPRVVTPGGPSILAWGDPPVVLRCGVPRPDGLAPGVGYQAIEVGALNQPQVGWLPVTSGSTTTYTTVDRSVYLSLQVPTGRVAELQTVSTIMAPLLPAVCKVTPDPGDPDPTLYCSERS